MTYILKMTHILPAVSVSILSLTTISAQSANMWSTLGNAAQYAQASATYAPDDLEQRLSNTPAPTSSEPQYAPAPQSAPRPQYPPAPQFYGNAPNGGYPQNYNNGGYPYGNGFGPMPYGNNFGGFPFNNGGYYGNPYGNIPSGSSPFFGGSSPFGFW